MIFSRKKTLSLCQELLTQVYHLENPVLRIREIQKTLYCVCYIRKPEDNAFNFKNLALDQISKEIKIFDVKNVCQDTDIAHIRLRINIDIYLQIYFSLTSTIK